MHQKFLLHAEHLDHKFNDLLTCPEYLRTTLPSGMPTSGIYLFSEGTNHLYVGRSNRLRDRIVEHGRLAARRTHASFAFLLAVERASDIVSQEEALPEDQRNYHHDQFEDIYTLTKLRVSQMTVRFVEEQDQVKQTLLEIYAAVVLETPHNDFRTH